MVLRTSPTSGALEVQEPVSEGWVPLQSVVTPPDGLVVEVNPTQALILQSIQSLLTTIEETVAALQILTTSVRDTGTTSGATLSQIQAGLDPDLEQLQVTTAEIKTVADEIKTLSESNLGVAEEIEALSGDVLGAINKLNCGAVNLTWQALASTASAYPITIPANTKRMSIACRGRGADITGDLWIANTAIAAIAGSDEGFSSKRIPNGVEFYQENLSLSNNLVLYLTPAVAGTVVVIETWS